MEKLIKITGLLLVGLLTSSSALAYYVNGGSVYYGSSTSPGGSADGQYSYSSSGGTVEGYIGSVNAGLPGSSLDIGTNYLVTSPTTYVMNYEVFLDSLIPTVHWFQFTADAASIVTAKYEWGAGLWSGSNDVFSIELYRDGDETNSLYESYSFTGDQIGNFPTSGHYSGFFADIPAGDWLIRIKGIGNGDEDPFNDSYSVSFEATSAVPLPPAALLFISALAGFGVVGRKRAHS